MRPLPSLSLRGTATLLAFFVASVLAVVTVLVVSSNLEQSFVQTAGLLASARARTAGDVMGTEIGELTADLRSVRSAIEQFGVSSRLAEIQAWLESIQRSKSEYTWIGIADETGKITVGTHGQKVGADESATEWFRAGRAGLYYGRLREAAMLAPELPPLPGGEPWRFVDIAMPLGTRAGAAGKVLVVHLSWPWLRQRLFSQDAAFPADSDLWLLGPDNQPWLGRDSHSMRSLALTAVSLARQGKAGWIVENWPDGHPYVTGYSPAVRSSDMQTVYWVTLARRRADLWPERVQSQFTALAWLAAAVVALVTACVWIACTLWLRPLRDFAVHIHQMPEGEPPPRPPSHLPQEFHWLNDAIVALVARLNAKEAAVQRALAEVQHSFRAVGSRIPGVLATFRVTSEGRLQVTYVSDTCQHYYGVAADALIKHPLSWSKHADATDVQELGRAFTRLLFGGDRVLTHPVRFTGLDGRQRTLQLTIIPRDNDHQRVFDSISLDITDLLEARSEAERAARAKADFLASMSHELRTPLNAILGLSRAIEEGASDLEQRRQAQLLREGSETLTRTINDVLDIANVGAGTFELHPRRFLLSEVVQSSAHLFEATAASKGLSFVVEGPDDAPALIGDPVRLRQVLNNLLSNAFKFTRAGGVTLSVTLTRVHGGGSGLKEIAHVQFSVSDTGVGMTADQVQTAFERFEKGQHSTGAPVGTGLGLAIVKWLVEKMGGSVTLRSTHGYGSEFRLTIPFEVASVATANGTDVASPDIEPQLRVLIADDYDINRHVLRALLEQRGHLVFDAEDGVQAVDLASRVHPELILMDVDMPNLDGLEAARRIRSLGGDQAAVPIYALTGKTFREDIERVSASGMSGHLPKPVELDQLVAVLRSAHTHRATARGIKPALA
jgi:signal transduction histidine kinase/CheY-like chemotaxis protein